MHNYNIYLVLSQFRSQPFDNIDYRQRFLTNPICHSIYFRSYPLSSCCSNLFLLSQAIYCFFLDYEFLSRRLKNLIFWWKISLRGPLFKHLWLQWIIGPMRSISNLNGLYIHIHIFCFVGELKKGIESRKYLYLLLQGKNFWCSYLMDISHAWDIGLSVDQFILYYTSNFLRLYLFIHIQKNNVPCNWKNIFNIPK